MAGKVLIEPHFCGMEEVLVRVEEGGLWQGIEIILLILEPEADDCVSVAGEGNGSEGRGDIFRVVHSGHLLCVVEESLV